MKLHCQTIFEIKLIASSASSVHLHYWDMHLVVTCIGKIFVRVTSNLKIKVKYTNKEFILYLPFFNQANVQNLIHRSIVNLISTNTEVRF